MTPLEVLEIALLLMVSLIPFGITAMIITEVLDGGTPLDAWNVIKRFVRRLGETLIEIVTFGGLFRRSAPVLEREPDWDLAAEEAGFFEPLRLGAIEAWTPAEREALGVDDTDALIGRIHAELGEIEWNRFAAKNPTTGRQIVHTMAAGGITGSRIQA